MTFRRVRAAAALEAGRVRVRNRAYARADLARDVLAPALEAAQLGGPLMFPEFRFAAPRRWRFDLAWPFFKVAVEVHGGDKRSKAYGNAHAGGRLAADCEKMRAAALEGWCVLPFGGSEIKTPAGLAAAVDAIRRALESRGMCDTRNAAAGDPPAGVPI